VQPHGDSRDEIKRKTITTMTHPHHPQVTVDYLGYPIEVDEGLKELLPLIWSYGIDTLNSCQENKKGIAWIQFSGTGGFRKFLGLIARYPQEHEIFWETLYGRMMQHGSEGDWKYDMLLVNSGVIEHLIDDDEIVAEHLGFNFFDCEISVRFPVSDIELLTTFLLDWKK
jgi:hypothetical protein